jgi:D-glycero-D-manno-heptose 1,7-bisphosphate phosphatase
MRPTLFLDRDGVINHDFGHVYRVEDFIFVDGIFELTRLASEAGYQIFVVTNQGGIGRGLYSEDEFMRLSDWMSRQFAAQGAVISKVYYCPVHPEHGVGKYRCDSDERKPHPGMLLRADAEFGCDFAKSLMLGDKHSDMQAAKAAGVLKRIFFPNPRFEQHSEDATHQIKTLREVFSLL